MGRETTDDEDEVAALRRQVQDLTATLKNITSWYDRHTALLGASITPPTNAPSTTVPQYNVPITSHHGNHEKWARQHMIISDSGIRQGSSTAILATTPPPPTAAKAGFNPPPQPQQPATHNPKIATGTLGKPGKTPSPYYLGRPAK